MHCELHRLMLTKNSPEKSNPIKQHRRTHAGFIFIRVDVCFCCVHIKYESSYGEKKMQERQMRGKIPYIQDSPFSFYQAAVRLFIIASLCVLFARAEQIINS
jgi:hypothetical protein